MPAPTATGRSTPYQTFGALCDRIKEIIDDLPRRPFDTPMLHRNDTTVALKMLCYQPPGDGPSAKEINRARRVAFKTAHPDMLTGSPEFSSDREAPGRCLKGPFISGSQGVHRDGDLGTHAPGGGRMGTDQEPCGVPAAAEEATSGSHALPNGRERPRAAADAANCSTARADPPSDCH